MKPTVKLTTNGDGSYAENAGTPNEVVWVRTDYSDPAEFTGDECCVCAEPIDGPHMQCLDGGDAAHEGCVEIAPESEDV